MWYKIEKLVILYKKIDIQLFMLIKNMAYMKPFNNPKSSNDFGWPTGWWQSENTNGHDTKVSKGDNFV